MRRLLMTTAAAMLCLVTACSSQQQDDEHGVGDAPVATASDGVRGGDDAPATCTNMPDGFGNVCTKCVAGRKPWAVVAGTNTDYSPSNFVLVQDPIACGGDWVPGAKAVVSTHGKGVEPPDDDG